MKATNIGKTIIKIIQESCLKALFLHTFSHVLYIYKCSAGYNIKRREHGELRFIQTIRSLFRKLY